MEKGTNPASEPVQELARQARDLVEAFTGGDPEIEASLNEMCEEEGPEKASRGMADAEVHVYLGKAIEALDAFLCEVAYIARASEGESEQRL